MLSSCFHVVVTVFAYQRFNERDLGEMGRNGMDRANCEGKPSRSVARNTSICKLSRRLGNIRLWS